LDNLAYYVLIFLGDLDETEYFQVDNLLNTAKKASEGMCSFFPGRTFHNNFIEILNLRLFLIIVKDFL